MTKYGGNAAACRGPPRPRAPSESTEHRPPTAHTKSKSIQSIHHSVHTLFSTMHGGWRHEPPTTLNKVPSLRRSPQHPLRHLRQSCSRIVGTMANVTPARAGVFVFVGLFLVAASLMLQHYNDSPSAAVAAAAAGLRRSLLSNVDDDLDSITL